MRPKQIYYQLYYRFLRDYKPKIARTLSVSLNVWRDRWSAPRYIPFRLNDNNEFICFGESARIDKSTWSSARHSALWLYHLHYFEALSAQDADVRVDQLIAYIDHWVEDNTSFQGVGWEPYPTSIRVVHWITWFSSGIIAPKSAWLASLALQAQVLMRRIEYHILANHLFANAKALVFLGVYFSGMEAEKWLKKGLKILDKEMHEQFLKDGGHFELSPMYHAILLWDVCDLLHLAHITGFPMLLERAPYWQRIIKKGFAWLQAMTHPDGEIAFFNDSTLDQAPKPADLERYLDNLGIAIPMPQVDSALCALESSGYVSIRLPDQGKAILDVGKVGPNYQPGHGHADTLSMELSLFGRRVIVNSGISEYGLSEERLSQRGTRAHSTVLINNTNSSDVWSGFRVARRAFPHDLVIKEAEGGCIVQCSQNGYARGPHRVTHQRVWTFLDDTITVVDTLMGEPCIAEARFYFHPDVLVTPNNLCIVDRKIRIDIEGASLIRVESSYWHSGFGRKIPNQCLVISFDAQEIMTRFLH